MENPIARAVRALFGDERTVTCEHEKHGPVIGHNTLRNNRLFYEVYDRPKGENTYWSENDGVYVKLQMYELKYVCTCCGKVWEIQTPERVGGEDGIVRKAEGRPDEDVTTGGFRKGWHWYHDNREQIEEKYHDS